MFLIEFTQNPSNADGLETGESSLIETMFSEFDVFWIEFYADALAPHSLCYRCCGSTGEEEGENLVVSSPGCPLVVEHEVADWHGGIPGISESDDGVLVHIFTHPY